MKTAVVLMNLGGPLGRETVRPFLFNFFMDKNIIGLPLPFRYLLAQWISRTRSKGAAQSAYAPLNFISPLLKNTQEQAAALQKNIDAKDINAKIFVSMRYWHPLAAETIRDVREYQPDQIILLPLYPQYSTTTSFSSFQNWERAAKKSGLTIKTEKICCYPSAAGFIKAAADHIKKSLVKAPPGTRLLLSAHGLPEKIIQGGDPYQMQCEMTAKSIVEATGIPGLDWQICYQSRVGPLKWIGPSLIESLEQAAKDKVGVVVFPHAFVSEHVETLVELDIEARHLAKNMGIPYFDKVETVGTHPDFIEALSSLVTERIDGKLCDKVCSDSSSRCAQGQL